MRIFSTLPAEVRKVLARRELHRRGLAPRPQVNDCRLWLPHVSLADLERLENLLLGEAPACSIGSMTPDGRVAFAEILGAALRAIGAADTPNEPARCALGQLLQSLKAA